MSSTSSFDAASRLGHRLVVASGNRHKVGELRAMLQSVAPDLDVVGLDAFVDPPTIDESGKTFVDNATLKARGIAQWLADRGEPGSTRVLADDSGICVDALQGDPGVRSARFAGEHASDDDNNRALVSALERLGLASSPAHYSCVLALVRVDGEPLPGDGSIVLVEGSWPVTVRIEARGTGGFGYDPHAWLQGEDRTVAELDRDSKAARSHRGAALRALLQWARAR